MFFQVCHSAICCHSSISLQNSPNPKSAEKGAEVVGWVGKRAAQGPNETSKDGAQVISKHSTAASLRCLVISEKLDDFTT